MFSEYRVHAEFCRKSRIFGIRFSDDRDKYLVYLHEEEMCHFQIMGENSLRRIMLKRKTNGIYDFCKARRGERRADGFTNGSTICA